MVDQNFDSSERTQTTRRRVLAVIASLALAMSACSKPASDVEAKSSCKTFGVYAQNRWAPLGAAERQDPDILAPKIGGFAANEVIAVDGWVHSGKPTYPTNSPPWNNDVWFRLANSDGWVSFAGVRGEPTSPDATGHAGGGLPAPTTGICKLD